MAMPTRREEGKNLPLENMNARARILMTSPTHPFLNNSNKYRLHRPNKTVTLIYFQANLAFFLEANRTQNFRQGLKPSTHAMSDTRSNSSKATAEYHLSGTRRASHCSDSPMGFFMPFCS